MATNVPPPPKRALTSRLQMTPPAPTAAPDNLSKPTEEIQDMNFKVSASLHREFKLTAVSRGMSMKELLEASFRAWKELYGKDGPSF